MITVCQFPLLLIRLAEEQLKESSKAGRRGISFNKVAFRILLIPYRRFDVAGKRSHKDQ